MKGQEKKALFISHATPEDNDFVRWLGAKLTAMGYEVWADVMHLHGGIDWARELEQALRQRAIKVLLVCTPNGLDKRGVRNEIEIATNLARQLNDDAFIVPLRLESYEAPFRIAHAQYIDFKGGWAKGLAELYALLQEQKIPRGTSKSMPLWLETHAEGAAKLLAESEPLVSNWLEIDSYPQELLYCEPPVGASLELFQHRQEHAYPCVPHQSGVLTFASPAANGLMGANITGKVVAKVPTRAFLEDGWQDYGISRHQAHVLYTDIASQSFEHYCASRGLKGYVGAGNRISWWADIKTAPLDKVRFDWGYRKGARKVIGHSPKRGVHWHYAINTQLRTSPLQHLRVSSRLIFSTNGIDAMEDARRSHTLRRSFAKAWRNARWRDLMCAFLWWLSDDKNRLRLPVASDGYIDARLPPMQFACPVSVRETAEDAESEDAETDTPIEYWEEESPEEE